MAYNYGKTPEESKRISWLSIFSSLLQSHPNCTEKEIEQFKVAANNLVDGLFENYKEQVAEKVILREPDGSETPFISGVCDVCGTKKIMSKKGNLFCPNKCWLRK